MMKAFANALRAERLKFRRCPVFLVFVLFTLMAAGLGTANYLGNLGVLRSAWYSLWTQHTLFACMLFLPAELGVVCAWQWRLEHSAHCWNTLRTAPLPFAALYAAKLVWSVLLALLAMAFTALCYLVGGVLIGLPFGEVPPMLTEWLVCGWLGCCVVCAWQQLISMVIRSFAVPVAVSLVFGICGQLLMAKGYGLAWPWALLSLGMRANDPNRLFEIAPFLLMCAVFTVLPTAAALLLVRRQDVRSE